MHSKKTFWKTKNTEIGVHRIVKVALNQNCSSMKHVYIHFWKYSHTKMWAHNFSCIMVSQDYTRCLYLWNADGCSILLQSLSFTNSSMLKTEEQIFCFCLYIKTTFKCSCNTKCNVNITFIKLSIFGISDLNVLGHHNWKRKSLNKMKTEIWKCLFLSMFTSAYRNSKGTIMYLIFGEIKY